MRLSESGGRPLAPTVTDGSVGRGQATDTTGATAATPHPRPRPTPHQPTAPTPHH